MRRFFKERFSIVLIILLSSWVNITGLIPNTYLHQNEPGVLAPSDAILKNFLESGHLDPNVKPDPFKYASAVFYMHAVLRGGVILFYYASYKMNGYTFGADAAHFTNGFIDFTINQAPIAFANSLLWISRFSSVIFSVSTVFLTYLIALKLFKNKLLANLSALSLLVMPLFTRNSHYATVDIMQTFFFTLSFFVSLRILDNSSFKNYAIAGFFIGFSSSLKYFPLALVPFLIIHLFVVKHKLFSKPFVLSTAFIFLGYLAGMPYFFIYFKEILGFIPYALTWYGPDQLEQTRPLWTRIFPSYFHAFHIKFLVNYGIYLTPLILAILGAVIGLKKYPRTTLILLSIPLVNGLFITFYVKQIYEQLTLPMLPFLAIFIALSIQNLFQLISRINIPILRLLSTIVIIVLAIIHPFFNSALASLDCTKPITDFQTRDWIKNNIPEGKKFAYHPGTRHPYMDMAWIESTVKTDFSYSELQEKSADYVLLIDGYYSISNEWFTDLFFPPQDIVDNQYVNLAISEFRNQANFIVKFTKHPMCTSNILEIYKLPKPQTPATVQIKKYDFSESSQSSNFKLSNSNEEVTLSHQSEALKLEYKQSTLNHYRKDYQFYYSTPLFSNPIKINEKTKYTIKARVKPEIPNQAILRDGYLRMDFYDNSDKILQTNLSVKADAKQPWQVLELTAISPEKARFLTIGFQSLMLNDFEVFLLDDIEVYEE